MTIAGRITVDEIAARLSIGRAAVYTMLERHIIPAIRLGRRWIVTRSGYMAWECTCGKETVPIDVIDIAA
jgi:excisionase family DNA binding protein